MMARDRYATLWRQAAPLPSGFAGRTRALLRHSVLSLSSAVSRGQEETYLRCLYCHYVFDDQRQAFEDLIVHLGKIARFITTDDCIRMLTGGKSIDGRYFHLSFDDGFRNTFRNAFPILKKHDVPAIFFVPSSIIDADEGTVRNYCMSTSRYRAVMEVMRWKDLAELMLEGYDIGSHTRTHARLRDISASRDVLEDEIAGSKRELEASLNYECKYISWPFGTLKDTDPASMRMVENAGYRACFGAYRGTVRPGSTDVFCIPRHHFEVQWPVSHVEFFAKGNMEFTRPDRRSLRVQ